MISYKEFEEKAYKAISDKEKKYPEKLEVFIVLKGDKCVNGHQIGTVKLTVYLEIDEWGSLIAWGKYKKERCRINFIPFGVCSHDVPTIELPSI